MDRITSGSEKIKGCVIGRLKEEELAKIRLETMEFIFEDSNLLKKLSLIDIVMFPALVSKDADNYENFHKGNSKMSYGIDHDNAMMLERVTGLYSVAKFFIVQ